MERGVLTPHSLLLVRAMVLRHRAISDPSLTAVSRHLPTPLAKQLDEQVAKFHIRARVAGGSFGFQEDVLSDLPMLETIFADSGIFGILAGWRSSKTPR